jgi:hypothetical protein
MFAPRDVTNRGQTGYIMSDPMSFRNDARAKVRTVFLVSDFAIIAGKTG